LADQISVVIEKKIKEAIPVRLIESAARAMGDEAVQLNLERLNSGLDVNGKQIRKYSSSYLKAKPKLISGRWKLRGTKTIYKANSMPNYGRLTGQTLADFDYKVVQKADFSNGKVYATIQLFFKTGRSKQIADYNKSRGRDYYGIAKGGAAVQKEKARLLKAFLEHFKFGKTGEIKTK